MTATAGDTSNLRSHLCKLLQLLCMLKECRSHEVTSQLVALYKTRTAISGRHSRDSEGKKPNCGCKSLHRDG